MALHVILIRHGIAEGVSADGQDASRHLTEKGKKKLRKALKGIRPLLTEGERPLIWSSPLVRAVESAEILQEILGTGQVEELPCIATGDLETFRMLVEELPHDPEPWLFVVGHEPHLGNWTRKLTGVSLPFGKGSAAAFLSRSGELDTLELRWFLQSSAMAELKSEKKPKQDK